MTTKRASLHLVAAFALCAAVRADEKWLPFHLPWEAPVNSPSDARFLLDAPAGKHGAIANHDGHFVFGDGTRARFWAVNLSGEGCVPPREIAPRAADRLAKFGFNLVRFHGLDSRWGHTLFPKNAPDTQHFDPEQLEKLDYLIAELEKRGIYVNLNLHVGRHFTAGDSVPQSEWLGYGKFCVIFDPRMIELQKDYARKLFTHRNPHTGRTYAEDPAVIIIELTNENSLFGGWTSGYLRGKQTKRGASTWADIPPYYGEELTRFYNVWLAKRYPTREALAAAWEGGARPPGAQMLRNGNFNAGTDGWELSKRPPAAAAALETPHDAPDGKRCAKITVTAVDGTPWHIMLTQRLLKLQKGMQYRVAFRARASASRQLAAEVCHSSPYRGYGSARFEVGADSRDCQFTFTAPEDDDQVRLSFQFGDVTGTVWVSDAILHEAPIYGLRDNEDMARGTVRRLEPEDFACHTVARFRDEGRFYYELESRYNREMYRFLRDELKVRALIEGTNHNYGLPCLRAEALLDLMDCHAYWQHPHFPRQPWSRTDWTIGNKPMLDEPRGNCISQLSRSSVVGKPFTVSEYNHPFPNEYGCEMPLLLAAYASLQDWDAVYGYTFNHRWDDALLGGNRVTGYFDLANEVSKMAQMPTASLIFQKNLVRPAKKLITVGYDENRTYDSLKEKRWDRIGFHLVGELSPLLPLVHRFRVERFDAPRTTRADEVAFNEPAGRAERGRGLSAPTVSGSQPAPGRGAEAPPTLIESDTGELVWEASEKGAGRLTINTPKAQAAVGWIGGRTVATMDAEFCLKTPFCAVSLIALDDQPLSRSKKILLVAAARCANTGMEWNKERNSLGDRWGGPPLLVERVEGEIALRRDAKAAELKLTPLDGCGLPQAGQSTTLGRGKGGCLIPLGRGDTTVWYVLEP